MQVPCFLLLGSNKGNKLEILGTAGDLIEHEIGIPECRSSIYETEPWGYVDNETYYNQALKILTILEPEVVLAKCLAIEKHLGRIRIQKGYEARTIDIDILFFGESIIKTEQLILPHPRLQERRFALEPLNEICPDFYHPLFFKTVNQLLIECEDKKWVRRII